MKLIGTRIRVEKSNIKTEYFPEYCLEEKTWFGFGKPKHTWFGVCWESSHGFSTACVRADHLEGAAKYSEAWAKFIVDEALCINKCLNQYRLHEETKETTYVKYP